jgi:DNA polymerase-1
MMQRKAAERAAINAPLQGTAADLIKQAMIAISTWQNQTPHPKATMIMQVHDELVFEVQLNDIDTTTNQIKTLMEQTVTLSVPLVVSIGVGTNWDETHA